MGQGTSALEAGMGDFTVAKSNPSGNIVRFTISTNTGFLTTKKMIRAILADAIQQWVTSERSDLDTNGDSDVKGAEEHPGTGDGFSQVDWDFANFRGDVTLTALTNISSSGNLTAAIAYADVA